MELQQLREQETLVAGRFAMEAAPTRVDRDWPIVEALRRRDPTAAERLVIAYGARAYRLAIRITGSGPDAEEAVQDAFWIVVRKIDTFRGDSGFGSWLYRIVANTSYGKRRRGHARRLDLSLDEVLPTFDERGRRREPVADWSAQVNDPSAQSELRRVLTVALDELPAEYRAVTVLRDVEGFSYREVGEVLGITVPSAKARVHRARLFLRKRLAGYMDPGSGVPGRSVGGPRPARAVGALESSDD
jgi:RNA polymerase sigma-70 factor (ECF subfamily)